MKKILLGLIMAYTSFSFISCEKEQLHSNDSVNNGESPIMEKDVTLVYDRYYESFKIDGGTYGGAQWVSCDKVGSTCAIYDGALFKKPVLTANINKVIEAINTHKISDFFKTSSNYNALFPHISNDLLDKLVEGNATVYLKRDIKNNPVFVFADISIGESETNNDNIYNAIIIDLK